MPDAKTCLRRLRWSALALALFAGCAAAAPQLDHSWTVEVSGDRCVATVIADDKTVFEFNALRGDVGFEMFAPEGKRILQAATAQLKADDHVFAFEPHFFDGGVAVYLVGILRPKDLKAVRSAHMLSLTVGENPVMEIIVEGTGLDLAIDDMIACSNGKSGWWGAGAKS